MKKKKIETERKWTPEEYQVLVTAGAKEVKAVLGNIAEQVPKGHAWLIEARVINLIFQNHYGFVYKKAQELAKTR